MRTTVKKIGQVLDKAERKRFNTLIAAEIFISLADIFSLVALLWIIQFYIHPGPGASFLPAWMTEKGSVWLIGLFVLFFTAKNLFAYRITKAHYRFVAGVAARITRNNLLYYQQDSFDQFVHTDSSVQVHKIYFQPVEFCQYILSAVQQIIVQSVLVLLTAVSIIFFNAKLFILLLAVLIPPALLVFGFIRKRLTRIKKDLRQSNERSFQHLQDALKGYVEGHIYGRNEFFRDRFTQQHNQFSQQLFSSISIQQLPSRLIEVFAVLGLFVLVAAANWSGNYGPVDVITIGAFMAAAYKIIPGMVKIINLSGQLQAYKPTLDDLVKRNTGEYQGSVVAPTIDKIEFRNVSFRYKNQLLVNRLSFVINKGDLAAISGDSGAGKTTMINLLLGFLEPEQGQILINDLPLDQEQRKRYWPSLAYVRQQPFFIHDSVQKNILLADEEPDAQRLKGAISFSGLEEFLHQFPQKTDKIITENGKNISGGQQQRVMLARAIYRDAGLLILDESFSELDKTSVRTMIQKLQQLAGTGKTVILITHDKESLSFCNKIIPLGEKQ